MKSFCIIGLGKFGQTLAHTLSQKGHQVMIIDENPDAVAAMADIVTNAVVGDPTSESVLRAAGVGDYDCAVICIANNINDNIMVTILLKELGVRQVVARAISDMHEKVLKKLGADQVVFPERDMGEKVANMLAKRGVLDYIEFSDKYSIVEIQLPRAWEGKSIAELNIRRKYGVTIMAVMKPNGSVDLSPSPTDELSADDRISLMGANEKIEKLVGKV